MEQCLHQGDAPHPKMPETVGPQRNPEGVREVVCPSAQRERYDIQGRYQCRFSPNLLLALSWEYQDQDIHSHIRQQQEGLRPRDIGKQDRMEEMLMQPDPQRRRMKEEEKTGQC